MDARAALDAIYEFISAKTNAELHPEFISQNESEAQLNKIAEKYQQALDAPRSHTVL